MSRVPCWGECDFITSLSLVWNPDSNVKIQLFQQLYKGTCKPRRDLDLSVASLATQNTRERNFRFLKLITKVIRNVNKVT